MSPEEKIIWIDVGKGTKKERHEKFVTFLENGFRNFVCLPEDIKTFKKFGKSKIASDCPLTEASDFLMPDVCVWNFEQDPFPQTEKKIKTVSHETALKICVNSGKDIETALRYSHNTDYLFVETGDWKIIPLENLRAETWNKKIKIIACVKNPQDAHTALKTLETGVDGVLIDGDVQYISELKEIIKKATFKIELKEATVLFTKVLGSGDRVCVDTCHILDSEEGMLVGSSSFGFFLVLSESTDTQYSAARPFRVNAGAVHSYIMSDFEKTMYLSEIKSGKNVIIADTKGNTKIGIVGRSKTEKRPLILIKAEVNRKAVSVILQNAETVKLAAPNGKSVSVTELKPGDRVLVTLEESTARHFGTKIKETITEK